MTTAEVYTANGLKAVAEGPLKTYIYSGLH